jgi:hypothetical protein
MTTKGKIFVIAGALVVSAAVVGGVLYRAFPVQISTMAGLTRNYFLTLNLTRRRGNHRSECCL